MTSHSLHNLRIAVTGGTSGLGRGLVRELLARGASVAFVARHRPDVERTMLDFPAAHGIAGDISRKEDVHPIAIQILGALDGLDVLINNASSLGPVPLRPLADTDCEDFEVALATNLVGPFRLTKALLGALAASARDGVRPVVINISSDAAVSPYENWGAYGASKAALQHLSRIWDAELTGEGIRVVSIDPGDMDTPLHALAVPDADRSTLKHPETAAREIADQIAAIAGTPEGVPYEDRRAGIPEGVPYGDRRAPFQGRLDAEAAR
ncbi:MAG TPA: SDR family oxidoreductase [Vicinamibacterales bacterium]|nr:SDR family oxidoreductase [Vicinamibacterales bacterium]